MVYVIQVCKQLASRIRMEHPDGTSWSCSQAVSKPVWHIPLLCVQWKIPNNGQRNCPKNVEFKSKNKFEKLVHVVGFNIRKSIMLHGDMNVKCLTLFYRATHMHRRTVQVLKWSVCQLDTALWLTVWLLGQEWRTALRWVLRRLILC